MHWARQSLKTLPATVKAPARLALMLLADYADEQHASWPSITTMSEEMGCSVRSVQRAIELLQAHGLVRVEIRHAVNGRQMSNRYHLGVDERFPVGRQSDTPSISDQSGEGDNLTPPEGDKLTGEGDTGDRGRVSPVSPLESTTRTLPPTPSLTGADASDSPDHFGENLSDDGQPLDDSADQTPPLAGHRDRKQPMTLDWEPDMPTWQRACFDRGLPVDIDVGTALIDFREHFAAQPGRSATPADWTRRFAKWVHQNLQRQAAKPAHGGDHANRRDRTPARRLTAAEARARDRAAQQPHAGRTFDGQCSGAG
ncbi:hypothetical protein HALO32_02581 [Halomonas lysinitropha]|uniref:DnaT DNA-binding domain-containing protein n=2 Tax=Halomonas lysinitropha TaxID=2607506 RepID=A0A5K1I7N2_9GAMM|nr:hypothetical protein HALO32_02581 [Halomonas lysinitropha]